MPTRSSRWRTSSTRACSTAAAARCAPTPPRPALGRARPRGAPGGEPQTCALPSLSRVPQHMVQDALYDHTFNWVAYGIAPPSAPVITTATPAGGAITRDSLGLAQGGIRLAQQDAPLRVNSGTNTGPGFCFLDGSSLPLTDAQLAQL